MDEDKERPADSPAPEWESGPEADAGIESSEPVHAGHPRWDPPARQGFGRRIRDALSLPGGSLPAGLRVAALVCLTGGALSAVLLTMPPGAQETTAAVRAPTVIASRSVPAESVPAPPAAPPARAAPRLTYEASDAFRDLDLRGATSGFVRPVPEAPASLCRRLEAAGWSTQGWARSPLGDIQECLADRRYGGDGKVEAFAVLRGDEALSELRIKLNIADAGGRGEAARDVGDFVADAFDRWHWDGAKTLGDRIAALEPFEAAMSDTKVRLMREHGDVERWNLVLRFPARPKPAASDKGLEDAGTLSAFRDLAAMPLAEPPDGGKPSVPSAR